MTNSIDDASREPADSRPGVGPDMESRSGADRTGRSLSRTLVLWFLVLSLLPLAVVSVFSYRIARASLQDTVSESLQEVAELKTTHIRSYFDRLLTDLREQSENRENTAFLQALVDAHKKSGKPVGEFVGSYPWELVVDERGADLKNFQKLFGYYDVFLLDSEGDVLFSVRREEDLGSNLFTGKYSDTLFAAACRKALESGRPVFADLEFYGPSGGEVAGFLTTPILNEEGDKIGLFAMQMPIARIDAVMQAGSRMGQTQDSYLIGVDLTMRSNSRLADEPTILRERIDTEQTQLWLKNHGESGRPLEREDDSLRSYVGYRGATVIGVHSTIDLAGVRMGVMAEIEEREAYGAARHLATVSWWLFGSTAVLVALLSGMVAGRIARPLRELAAWAQRVGRGDLSTVEIRTPSDETGVLNRSFCEAVSSLREARVEREARDWLNSGVARLDDVMRGEENLPVLCGEIVGCLARHVGAQVGTISLVDGDNARLILTGGYAYKPHEGAPTEFKFGEGLIGQVARDGTRIVLTDVPEDGITVTSALGEALPRAILCFPFMYEGRVKGVIELGRLEPFTETQLGFLEQVADSIAIAVHSGQLRKRAKELLEESQSQAEELQAQQEELRTTNEELEEKTEELQAQQEALRVANEELEEKTEALRAREGSG